MTRKTRDSELTCKKPHGSLTATLSSPAKPLSRSYAGLSRQTPLGHLLSQEHC